MNILTKAIDHCYFTIPSQVLQIAFQDDIQNWRRAPISLNEQILNKVIRPRVMIDADIVGGQTIIVPLENVQPKYVDTYTIVYEIPAELLLHRTLMSVLSIGYLPYAASMNSLGVGMGAINVSNMTDLMAAGQRVGDSMSSIPAISNATCQIIGYNTVLIRDHLRITNAYQLRCVIGNEANLSNINPRSMLSFARLCELAVKSYIYNKLVIAVDQAYLTGGQELGRIKEVIDNYNDSEEQYQTYLSEVWRPTAYMQNEQDHQRFIKLMISPGL